VEKTFTVAIVDVGSIPTRLHLDSRTTVRKTDAGKRRAANQPASCRVVAAFPSFISYFSVSYFFLLSLPPA